MEQRRRTTKVQSRREQIGGSEGALSHDGVIDTCPVILCYSLGVVSSLSLSLVLSICAALTAFLDPSSRNRFRPSSTRSHYASCWLKKVRTLFIFPHPGPNPRNPRALTQ